ncbi:MAG: YigZ family protein [Oscillospiraceae bacterium]|jgi:uncharacterized YigZ family protein
MDSYLVPAGDGEAEFTEKHSRFIGRVRRTDTEEDALSMLREIREAHRDATHNVFAYRIWENNLTRYSDDGEPAGTSGLPTLGVFTGAEVTNVCCVVTRYFGGTLLGTGGLVRAYTKAAQLALEAAGIAQMALFTRFTLALPYPFYERTQRLLAAYGAVTESVDFGTDVQIEALIRTEQADRFEAALTDESAGRAVILRGESEFRAGPYTKA